MRRLIHISDLHFGTVRPGILQPLLWDIEEFSPDLVIVTGDLTQRATPRQFEMAREFLSALGRPYLVVPGNHDIAPLYRPVARLLDPYANYRRYVSTELDTRYVDDQLLVLGLNTVAPLRWKEGTISRSQLRWIADEVSRHPGRFRIVAAHHPLAATVSQAGVASVRRRSELLDTLETAGVALCLTGHLHQSFREPFAASAGEAHVTLVVRASTATSVRIRDHGNAYNRIVLQGRALDIRVRTWTGNGFATDHVEHFRERHGRWDDGVIELGGQPTMPRPLQGAVP